MTCSKDQKVTEMVLKVDLDCCQCYKKVKKVLCKFPQIRNQVFDEKNNTVTITVFCCSPERIRDKLCCKAGKSIKSIEIKQPQKPKPAPAPAQPEKPKPAPAPAPAPAQPEKPKPAPAPVPVPVPVPVQQPEKPKPAPEAPAPAPEKIQKNGSKNGSKKAEQPPKKEAAPKPAPKPAEAAPKPAEPAPAPQKQQEPEAQWVPGYPPGPPPQMFPVSVCCAPCYEGMPGGPCHTSGHGPAYPYGYYGRPCPPPPGYYGSRCDYFSEENPAACSLM